MTLFRSRHGGIVRDARWLQPLSDPSDGKPLCRDDDLQTITSLLQGLFTAGSSTNLFICGPPGSGKTVCIRHLLREIRRHTIENRIPLAPVYVNAGKRRDPYYTMLQIVRELGIAVPESGWQMFRLKQAFEESLKTKPTVIAIDEFDALLLKQKEPLVYYLNRQPRTTLILISNRLEDISTLPPRLLSTLQPKILLFQPYTMEETRSILKDRAAKALYPDTLSEELLDTIAQTTAQAEDIRLGFAILLSAAHNAEEKGKSQIGAEDVEAAIRSNTVLGVLREMQALKQKLKAIQKDKGSPQPSWNDNLIS